MTVVPGSLMRPDDKDAYRKTLRALQQRSGIPMTFGGQVAHGILLIDELVGNRTRHLDGLKVQLGKGLGGRVAALGQPLAINDYASSSEITHDYDRETMQGEGIHGTAAVPVSVRGDVRGILYTAVHDDFPIGDRVLAEMTIAARQLGTELTIRDEVDRRVKLLETAALVPAPQVELTVADMHDLRAELRDIAQHLPEGPLRDRLRKAYEAVPGPREREATGPAPVLSPRERDVVAEIAKGCSNVEAADRLALRPETVKAYLRSASQKLGAKGRYQTVLAARNWNLIA